MSSIGAGAIVVQEGLEPIIQMTCRDRNRLAIQSDLLGAYALGMRNLLCLSGDHQTFGNHPGAKNVFDMDSIQLVQMVAAMRDQHVFQCGDAFKGPEPRFFVGRRRIALCRSGRVSPLPAGQESQSRRELHPDPVDLRHRSIHGVHGESARASVCTRKSTSWPESAR